ncbi:MAG TPA: hypothetical protein VNL71_22615, partial [Chloroflexota bacterium]|nr:hypothetical protein [Chloroflexota bacterium]
MTNRPPAASSPAQPAWRQTAAAIIAARIEENQITPDGEGAISARDAGLIAGVSERLIRNLGDDGAIPSTSHRKNDRLLHRYPLDAIIAYAEERAHIPKRLGRGRPRNQDLAASVTLVPLTSAAEDLGDLTSGEKRGGTPDILPMPAASITEKLDPDPVGEPIREAPPIRAVRSPSLQSRGTAAPVAPPTLVGPRPAPSEEPIRGGANPAQDDQIIRANQEALTQLGAEVRAQTAVLARVVENQNSQLAGLHERERLQQQELFRARQEIALLQATVAQQYTLLHQYHETLGAGRGGFGPIFPPGQEEENDRPAR